MRGSRSDFQRVGGSIEDFHTKVARSIVVRIPCRRAPRLALRCRHRCCGDEHGDQGVDMRDGFLEYGIHI
mgnify:CR=1 FL=1